MNAGIHTVPGYVSDFVRGFAAGTGSTLAVAKEFWENRCRQLGLSSECRAEMEARGYNAGQIEGVRWLSKLRRRDDNP